MDQGTANAHEIKLLELRMRAVERRFQSLEPLIRETHDAVVYAKGGLRVMLAVGAALTAVTIVASEFIHWLAHK